MKDIVLPIHTQFYTQYGGSLVEALSPVHVLPLIRGNQQLLGGPGNNRLPVWVVQKDARGWRTGHDSFPLRRGEHIYLKHEAIIEVPLWP
jgi:hypothetical protein